MYEGVKTRLTRKALVLGKIESTYNTDASPSESDDAVLVSEPDYAVDPTVLERNFVREDLSPLGTRVGRKIASLSFGMELRSNGSTSSGSTNDAAILGTLLRACGYSETGMTGNGTVSAVTADEDNTNDPTWSIGGTNDASTIQKYRVECVVGGASTTAELRVTGGQQANDTDVLSHHAVTASVYRLDGTATTVTTSVDDSDPTAVDITIGGSFQAGDIVRVRANGNQYDHTVVAGDSDLDGIATAVADLIDDHSLISAGTTSAVVNITYTGAGDGTAITSGTTAVTLGSSDMTITPTWTGSLTLGDHWDVTVYPTGIRYEPVSSDFESITLYAYFDGLKHKITGGYGTFSIEANAGEYGTVNFTFTGQYYAPEDENPPTGTHEDSLPPIVESSNLILDNYQPVVAAFTFDQNNEVVPRPDVNSSDGYNGVRITARDPQGGIDPEATISEDLDFWTQMADSTEFEFHMRIGDTAGNRISIAAPKVQYTGLTYGDRDGLRTYDAGLRFGRKDGDDEIIFCLS